MNAGYSTILWAVKRPLRHTCDEKTVHKANLNASEERVHANSVCWEVGEESCHYG